MSFFVVFSALPLYLQQYQDYVWVSCLKSVSDTGDRFEKVCPDVKTQKNMIFPEVSQFFLSSGLLKLDYSEKISFLQFHSFIQQRFIDHVLFVRHINWKALVTIT